MEELFASLIKDFVEETEPLAREVANLVLRLEEAQARGGNQQEIVRAIRSALHTIKGNAAMMGLAPIESLAHALEDCCPVVGRQPEAQAAGDTQNLLEGADLLIRAIHGSLRGDPETERVISFLRRTARPGETAQPERAPPPAPSPGEKTGDASQRDETRDAGRTALDEDGTSATVRIADQDVDGLLDLTAEAIISQTELMRFQVRLARGHVQSSDANLLEQVLARLGRATAEMRHNLLRVRLAPISNMFRRYARYVRDLACERGQAVQLVIEGGDTAMDRAIISRLFEPLVHMVRNSVAHGIESPAERIAAGKPAEAHLLLGARLLEGRARLTVADDGRGLDMAGIAARARALGLDPGHMPEDQLRRLIFQPGFSTTTQVSTLSGRGVGLEVVANVVQTLGGSIDVRSAPGQGTVFVIDLPVTVSLVKALIFGVDGEMFAVPASFALDTLAVREESLRESNRALFCPWRGDFLRTIDAGRLLGCSGLAQPWTRPYGIIVEAATKRCALLVDWLVGVQEIVVKPLDETLCGARVLSGLTILGQGRVVPILDCAEVVRRSSGAIANVPSDAERQGRASDVI